MTAINLGLLGKISETYDVRRIVISPAKKGSINQVLITVRVLTFPIAWQWMRILARTKMVDRIDLKIDLKIPVIQTMTREI
jgi:hypothetical protein